MSYPPPPPENLPVSTTGFLPAGCHPISDSIGLVRGSVTISLSPSSSSTSASATASSTPPAFDLEELKKSALEALKAEAKRMGASGVIEMGFELVVRAEGVGVLTVDTL